jgi:hypothetical protein
MNAQLAPTQMAPTQTSAPNRQTGTATRPDYTPTPDRRYYVVRGRLWRLSNPFLDETTHQRLVTELMTAKRGVRAGPDALVRIAARLKVDAVKRALGERGDVWWTDGAPDYHRCRIANTPYAEWYGAPLRT